MKLVSTAIVETYQKGDFAEYRIPAVAVMDDGAVVTAYDPCGRTAVLCELRKFCSGKCMGRKTDQSDDFGKRGLGGYADIAADRGGLAARRKRHAESSL